MVQAPFPTDEVHHANATNGTVHVSTKWTFDSMFAGQMDWVSLWWFRSNTTNRTHHRHSESRESRGYGPLGHNICPRGLAEFTHLGKTFVMVMFTKETLPLTDIGVFTRCKILSLTTKLNPSRHHWPNLFCNVNHTGPTKYLKGWEELSWQSWRTTKVWHTST